MQEILLEDHMRNQLSIQEQVNLPHGQTRKPRNRVKKTPKQSLTNEEATINIGESLKAEIELLPSKTPISILQELLSRRGITPTYELVQIEGAVHEPSFRYRVSFNDKESMAVGRSKKEAKHAAAKALIDKLTGMNISDQFYQAKSVNSTTASATNINFDENNQMNNPIGILQEFCMQKKWPPPQYQVEIEVGRPHEKEFSIRCTVLKFCEIGAGKSKKIAKRQAAQLIYEKLQNLSLDQNEVVQIAIDETNEEESNIPTLTNQHSFKVSQFHKLLKNKFGKSLAKLQNMCLNAKDLNFVSFLHEIATEHQFEVTYVDIEERTYSGKCQCLVQLSTLPVAVCQGSGQTSKEAQSDAAKNALEYLKIMTKK